MIQQFFNLNAQDTFFLLLPYIATAITVFAVVFIPFKIKLRKRKKAFMGLKHSFDGLCKLNIKHEKEIDELEKRKRILEKEIETRNNDSAELSKKYYGCINEKSQGELALEGLMTANKELENKIIVLMDEISEFKEPKKNNENICSPPKKSKTLKSKVKSRK